MNRKLFSYGMPAMIALILISTAAYLAITHGPDKRQIVMDLTQLLNEQLPGSRFETDLEKCEVSTMENGRYRIGFYDLVFHTDLTKISHTILGVFEKSKSPISNIDKAYIDSAQIVYGPKENYLNLESMKGFRIESDLSGREGTTVKTRNGSLNIITARAYLGNAEMDQMDLTRFFKNPEPPQKTIGSKTSSSGPTGKESTWEDVKVELEAFNEKNEIVTINLRAEKISNVEKGIEAPEINEYLFTKNASPPDLKKLLQQGLAVNDLKLSAGKVFLEYKTTGGIWIDAVSQKVKYTQFVRPDPGRNHFQMGHSIDLENTGFAVTRRQVVLLSDLVSSCAYRFSLDRINSAAVIKFLEIIKTLMKQENVPRNSARPELFFDLLQLVKIANPAQPSVNVSLSSQDRYLGSARAVLNLEPGIMVWPKASLSVQLEKTERFFKKLLDSGLVQESELLPIRHWINHYFVRDQNHNSDLLVELKPMHPLIIFINGVPTLLDMENSFFAR